jgi:hypothetical protein
VVRSSADFTREVANADAVIGGITKEDFPAAKKLKWVQTDSLRKSLMPEKAAETSSYLRSDAKQLADELHLGHHVLLRYSSYSPLSDQAHRFDLLAMPATLSGLTRIPWPARSVVLHFYDPAPRRCSGICTAATGSAVGSCLRS